MSERSPNSMTGFWSTILVVLIPIGLAAYVAAYLWMVKPIRLSITSVVRSGASHGAKAIYCWGPNGKYVANQELCSSLFAPLNALDRKVRPDKWTR